MLTTKWLNSAIDTRIAHWRDRVPEGELAEKCIERTLEAIRAYRPEEEPEHYRTYITRRVLKQILKKVPPHIEEGCKIIYAHAYYGRDIMIGERNVTVDTDNDQYGTIRYKRETRRVKHVAGLTWRMLRKEGTQ